MNETSDVKYALDLLQRTELFKEREGEGRWEWFALGGLELTKSGAFFFFDTIFSATELSTMVPPETAQRWEEGESGESGSPEVRESGFTTRSFRVLEPLGRVTRDSLAKFFDDMAVDIDGLPYSKEVLPILKKTSEGLLGDLNGLTLRRVDVRNPTPEIVSSMGNAFDLRHGGSGFYGSQGDKPIFYSWVPDSSDGTHIDFWNSNAIPTYGEGALEAWEQFTSLEGDGVIVSISEA